MGGGVPPLEAPLEREGPPRCARGPRGISWRGWSWSSVWKGVDSLSDRSRPGTAESLADRFILAAKSTGSDKVAADKRSESLGVKGWALGDDVEEASSRDELDDAALGRSFTGGDLLGLELGAGAVRGGSFKVPGWV